MTTTLDLSLASTRRHFQASTEDVKDWTRAAGTDAAAKARALGRVVGQVIAGYAELEEIDRLFRQAAGNTRPNPDAVARARALADQFAAYVTLADETLGSVTALPAGDQPPADRLAELRRLRDSADEMASVYRGEAEYFGGEPGVPWEEFRKTLGV
jgi:hypothetical protein